MASPSSRNERADNAVTASTASGNRDVKSLVSSLEGQNYFVFQAALTGGKYNSVTFRVSIVKNSARYETGSLYHSRSGALR